MNHIGLYLGGGSISVVDTHDKKIVSSASHPLDSISDPTQDPIVHTEAMLNKLTREVNISKNDAIYLSLHDRDFIFRSFLIPMMSKKEIESSIEFEIEKYIPFKIEELVWNYCYEKIANERQLIVSFVGYNKANYKKLGDAFKKLELDLIAVEPSSLSLLRLISNRKEYCKLNWYVMLDYSPQECFITFFYRTLPVFSRTIFSSRTDTLPAEKLREEVHFSAQYFKREFRAYDLEKMLVIADSEHHDMVTVLTEDIELPVDLLTPDNLVPQPGIDHERLKAYAASTYDSLPRKFRPLREDTITGFLYSKKGMAAPLNIPLIGLVGVVGVAGTIMLNMFTTGVISGEYDRLQKKKTQFDVDRKYKDYSSKDLNALKQKKESDISLLKDKIDSLPDVTPFLNKLSVFMTEGLWLDKFDLAKEKNNKLWVEMSGYVYRGDVSRERESIDGFISRLREDQEMKSFFPVVEPLTQEREKLSGYDVIHFTVRLRQ